MSKYILKLYSYFSFFLGLLLIIAFLVLFYDFTKPPPDPIQIIYAQNNISPDNTSNQNNISFTVSGAVNQPGKYTLPAGSIWLDGIAKAGNFSQFADMSNINQNLGSIIYDQQNIFIPSKTIENDITLVSNPAFFDAENKPEIKQDNSTKININIASKSELMVLTGVGESTAQKIIDYRTTNKFDTIEEIMEIKGIGEKSFEKIKDQITI